MKAPEVALSLLPICRYSTIAPSPSGSPDVGYTGPPEAESLCSARACGSHASGPVCGVRPQSPPAPCPLAGLSVPALPTRLRVQPLRWWLRPLHPWPQTDSPLCPRFPRRAQSWNVCGRSHPDPGVSRGGSLICSLCDLGQLINLSDPHAPVIWGP